MRRSWLFIATLSTIYLSGCYSVNRDEFTKFARSIVEIGDRFSDAEAKLNAKGFRCDHKSFAPSISCTRDRGGILYSCIERINLGLISNNRVGKVEIPQIVCASF